MSDVNALMDKLKSSVSYKQFDAPRATDAHAWPVLEKIAKAQTALSHFEPKQTMAPAPEAVEQVQPAVAPTVTAARVEGSLFDRLQAEATKAPRFGRYADAKPAEPQAQPQAQPQALSEIFDRIGRR